MTAFNPSQLPPEVNTVEKLVAWGTTVLSELYPDATVVETPGTGTPRAQSGPFEVRSNSQQQWIMINRLTVDLSSTWRRTGKMWDDVQPLGSLDIPAEYLA